MIHGIGTDIVAIARMRDALERHGERFAARLLHAGELAEFEAAREPARLLAKRFAAKEAFAKALGTGLRPPATLGAIGVTHDALGKPVYFFDDALAALLRERGLAAHLSLSDERDHVVAFALLETRP
ncbi:MAG: holo-ACP synthase [Candidatus Dactylopiibacterium sp.]|nr:holo-ACP synthase [Candidatus Dactylopiibacterium sp.]